MTRGFWLWWEIHCLVHQPCTAVLRCLYPCGHKLMSRCFMKIWPWQSSSNSCMISPQRIRNIWSWYALTTSTVPAQIFRPSAKMPTFLIHQCLNQLWPGNWQGQLTQVGKFHQSLWVHHWRFIHVHQIKHNLVKDIFWVEVSENSFGLGSWVVSQDGSISHLSKDSGVSKLSCYLVLVSLCYSKYGFYKKQKTVKWRGCQSYVRGILAPDNEVSPVYIFETRTLTRTMSNLAYSFCWKKPSSWKYCVSECPFWTTDLVLRGYICAGSSREKLIPASKWSFNYLHMWRQAI